MATYPPPVDQLLTIGWPEAHLDTGWLDYAGMGLAWEHAPELIRMMRDTSLEKSEKDEPRIYAPSHAMRALAQFGHEKAAQPILDLLAVDPRNYWILEDATHLAALLGPGSLPVIEADLARDDHRASSSAICCVVGSMPGAFPETRDRVVAILTNELSKGDSSDDEENAFIVGYLTDLKAVESVDAIKEAFAKDRVADYIYGSLEHVLYKLGLGEKPPEQARTTEWVRTGMPFPSDPTYPLSRSAEEKRKKDNKRKRQDQKTNRKRRK